MSHFTLELPSQYNASEVLFHNLEAACGDKVAVYWEDNHTLMPLLRRWRIGLAMRYST
jgi:hypothetical protein